MNSQNPLSLQAILRLRQHEEFVGREEQEKTFRLNLALGLNDKRRKFIFSIFGLGGVGKTSLLRRFSKLTESVNAAIAWTDEAEEDVPEVMARIVAQFGQQDHIFKTFNENYRIYRQLRHQLEADPEAPQGFSSFVGRVLTKAGIRLGRRIPIGGAVFDFVDEDAAASQISSWATYIARRLTNKDEVRLMQEPVEVLTPFFLEGLRKLAEKHCIALFFDTYEQTSEYLDDWLRGLLEGRYGEVPPNIILTIAGRDELDRNRWVGYNQLIARLKLESFTETEARQYLSHNSIINEQIIEVILQLSGHLPLLIATLAAESPKDPSLLGDPSDTAVERFLKWIDDPKRRRVVLDAALPRQLNRDILTAFMKEKDADMLFPWLKELPFVEQRTDTWGYHEIVRSQMLRYKLHESPQRWTVLHSLLAKYYEKLRDSLRLDEQQRKYNTEWQNLTLEILYHRLCQDPYSELASALNGFLAAMDAEVSFALRWAETMWQAEEDTKVAAMQCWGERLMRGLRAYKEDTYSETVVQTLTLVLANTSIETKWYPTILRWRSYVYVQAGQYTEALTDISRVIELNPTDPLNIANRGLIYLSMGRYDEGLADLRRLCELKIETLRYCLYQLQPRWWDPLRDMKEKIRELEDIQKLYHAAFPEGQYFNG